MPGLFNIKRKEVKWQDALRGISFGNARPCGRNKRRSCTGLSQEWFRSVVVVRICLFIGCDHDAIVWHRRFTGLSDVDKLLQGSTWGNNQILYFVYSIIVRLPRMFASSWCTRILRAVLRWRTAHPGSGSYQPRPKLSGSS